MEKMTEKILENLKKSNAIINKVTKRLDILADLFQLSKDKIIETPEGFNLNNLIEVKTLFQNGSTTISLGIWKKRNVNWPTHIHKNSIEYLVVIKGKFLLKIDEEVRSMVKGDCASIPLGVKHSCVSLEDDSQIIGICIPPEEAYILEKE